MKGWKLKLAAMAACLAMATGAHAQSSKFAATYDTDPVMVEVSVNGANGPDSGSAVIAEADLATLHVANWKELLVGVSSQVNLVTFTQVKGKNDGGVSTAIAEGTVRAGVLVVPEGTADCGTAWNMYNDPFNPVNTFVAPGPVTFASRRQELSIKVDLDVAGAIPEVCDEECIKNYLSIEGDVTVALGLDTTAAHHFNFVAANLTQGVYDVVACYDLTALAEVAGSNIDADTQAHSKAALGPRIVTAQEVRATKDGIIDESGDSSR